MRESRACAIYRTFLIDKGAVLRGNAFVEAAANGHVEILELLLSAGADVNAVATGRDAHPTALHIVAQGDHEATAKFLLSRGADVNARDRYGKTPLDYARRVQRTRMIEILGGPPK